MPRSRADFAILTRGGRWLLALMVVIAACGPNVERPTERSAQTRQALTGDDDDGESPPPLQVSVGYVTPDTGLERTQGLLDLAAMRTTLGKPYVGQGFETQGPGGGSNPCSTSNCASPDECISNQCSTPCVIETSCPFGTSQGTDSTGSCFCIPNTVGPGPSSGACGWMHAGPTNVPGRVLGLAVNSTAQTLLAATVGGIWRSTDGGRTWQRVSDSFLGGKAESVAINPANGSEVIAGLGDDQNEHPFTTTRPVSTIPLFYGNGIWISSQNGDPGTWTQVSPPALNASVVSQLLYSADGNTIYAATSAGVYIGTRSGGNLSFSQLGSLSFPTDTIAVDFSGSTPLVYAGVRRSGTNSGIWKYDGTTWTPKNSGITSDSFSRVALVMAPSNHSILYAKIASSTQTFTGFFKTTTAAESVSGAAAWTNVTFAEPGPDDGHAVVGIGTIGYENYNSAIAVDPTDPKIVYLGGVNLWRSTDSGSTWTNILESTDPAFESSFTTTNLHQDVHAVMVSPTNHGIVYVGTDGGEYVSSDLTSSTYHWQSISHGMTSTEFYDVANQLNTASLIVGGAQDNGTNITFGDRAWYRAEGGDGSNVSVDALENVSLYTNVNATEIGVSQPVMYAAVGLQTVAWNVPAGLTMSGPVVADPTIGGLAIGAAGTGAVVAGTTVVGDTIVRTTDRVNWTTVLSAPSGSSLPAGAWDSRHPIAISKSTNSSGKKTCYAGVQSGGSTPTITVYVSEDSGVTWTARGNPSGATSLNAITVDPTSSEHAIASTGGATGENVFVTSNGGSTWTQVTDSGAAPLPTGAVRNVAFDPTSSGSIYVAHQVGVFKGALSGTSVSWTTFDEGLPNGLDAHDIVANPATKVLTIGTYGYGAYQRQLGSSATCPTVQLLVRDNVFDEGTSPSPSGVPDPEHPIADGNTGFYKADDTNGGKVYFWDSTDIRIDVPSEHTNDGHSISQADNYEFETCPVERGDQPESCPPGTMVDTNPVRGSQANAYVQITNQGLQPAENVRVIALFTNATVRVPDLPSDFWTTTFPDLSTLAAGAAPCGALNSSSPWQLVGCKYAKAPVNPDYPTVVQFPWMVPPNAADHSCMVTIVESTQDPATSIRNKFSTESLVPSDRHIAQRNLHVVSTPPVAQSLTLHLGGFSGLTSLQVPNATTNQTTRTVLLSRSGMGNGRLSYLLPVGVASSTSNLPAGCGGTGSVPSGSTRFSVPFPSGTSEELVALAASGQLLVGDGVKVVTDAGGFGGIANAGTGLAFTTIGDHAQVGSIVSSAPVDLDENSVVNGSVEASASVRQEAGSTVTGQVVTNATLSPSDQLSWQAQVPSGSGPLVNVLPGQTVALAPGHYGLVSVLTGGKLTLSAGTYFMDTLNVALGGRVAVNTTSGATLVYLRLGLNATGTVTETPGGGANVMFVYTGILPAVVAGPFAGTVLAPSALLTLGPSGSGQATGAFLTQNLTVLSPTTIVQRPFTGWTGLGSCTQLSADEKATATQLGLDPTVVYPVAGTEQQVVLPVTPGSQLTLGLRYESGTGPTPATAARFRVVAFDNGSVTGGSTFVIRRP